ncbi:hypothetical protein [Pseudorhodoferax sp. LjRoot39]|uniref:hypothetical protein n=1 Tax=Pseudorhodoferax sp. LjRoot39 TaxID=3342328 RepID=UPI003F4F9570
MTATAALLLTAGCANTVYRGYSAAPISGDLLKPYTSLVEVLKGSSDEPGLVAAECFSDPAAGRQEACKQQRNSVIAALVIGSEDACVAHRKSIYGNDAGYNIALGTATNLFAGAASVIAHAHTKSVFSALALLSNSERSLVNETVYKTMLVTAVDKKILEVRDAKATALHQNLGKSLREYGMNDALRDWVSFHSSCSFMVGLQKALDEGIQTGNAQKALRLNATFRALTAERATVCAVPAPAPAASAPPSPCAMLDERLRSVSDELKTLEKL